jgi:uncharacterized protein YciI
MKTIRRLTVAIVAAVACFSSTAVTQEQKMATYQLVMLMKGPKSAEAQTADGQKIVQAHLKHLYAKGAEGIFKVAGPFEDEGAIGGIIFVAAPTPERALEIESADPMVKAGLFTMEAMPFMAPEGWFPGKWAEFGQFEHVYFGFLKRGPNRGQDEATANRLQQEHLAYMDGQAKQGKLVAAGPFVGDGERRGLVVYRVPTLEEAQQRGNADPMIKAGRLALELHPWQVPIGALPK